MKRDMDLIRTILLAVEAADLPLQKAPQIDGQSPDAVSQHIRILNDAGYLDHGHFTYVHGLPSGYGHRLTWAGHEFLDSIRDTAIWAKTKGAAEQLGSWSLEMLSDLAKGYIRLKAADLGLPIGPA